MSGASHRIDSTRRSFLLNGMKASGIALAPMFGQLHANQAEAKWFRDPGYGPLYPAADDVTGLELLKLPRGFRYQSFGWTGDLMSDGTLTPDRHDGMAVVASGKGRHGWQQLIRNHERGAAAPGNPLPFIGDGQAPTYDSFTLGDVVTGIGGGNTAITFERGRFTESSAVLAGTLTNCAGGPTHWGSWLSCEETTIRGSLIGARDHGYVFEVPAPRLGQASAVPIVDMGFMDHEAAAVDPRSSIVYLTEDNGPDSGFYRFIPHDTSMRIGSLEQGGRLEMLKVIGDNQADLGAVRQGETLFVEWVPIDDPDADPESLVPPEDGFPPIAGSGRSGPYLQGEAQGGARFSRLEGCWYHRGVIYFVDTSAGPAGKGVVWAYLPLRRSRRHGQASEVGVLYALFVSPNDEAADNPDNITLSPRGGILVCEDGGGIQNDAGETVTGARLIGVSHRGSSFVFAENTIELEAAIPGKPFVAPGNYRGAEFAGACFDPSGKWLFVNIQTPGVTFAITGPWRRGLL